MQATSPIHNWVTPLPTGTLTLSVEGDGDADAFCAVAARANPRRGFLIVSRVLGRHLPARPTEMRRVMQAMALKLSADLPSPVVFLGMAETATALGQGCFAAWQDANPEARACYLQSSRQRVTGATMVAQFEEGHSHATSHMVQARGGAIQAILADARTLIVVDDECSTGATFVAAAKAMADAMPALQRIETVCITDWSDRSYLREIAVPSAAHAMLNGRLQWTPTETVAAPALAQSSNAAGNAPSHGMRSRTGLLVAEHALRASADAIPGERVLVLGEGEHSYEALLVAEEVERAGNIAAVQCITRSPALLGHAMASVSQFIDSYGSGAPCFLYNMLAHAPDRIIIVSEIAGNQVAEAQAALHALGTSMPVELLLCHYSAETD